MTRFCESSMTGTFVKVVHELLSARFVVDCNVKPLATAATSIPTARRLVFVFMLVVWFSSFFKPDAKPGHCACRSHTSYTGKLREKGQIQPADHVFIDVGSGKGRIVFLAAEYSYKKIVGVEFDENCHRVAVRNFSRLRSSARVAYENIELHLLSILDYELPLENVVLFHYNPFGGETLALALRTTSTGHQRFHECYCVMTTNPFPNLTPDELDWLVPPLKEPPPPPGPVWESPDAPPE